jgi:hypothetical protein
MPWALPSDAAGLLALATDYPYAAPDDSYLFVAGEARALSAAGWRGYGFAGRVPVVAHGSNRSPQQLFRKFGRDAEIPVTYGRLLGYDVVYAAHVARYGAVTSTLAAVPGVAARVALTWLTPAQLAFMHETERMNYTFGHLPAGCFQPEVGPAPDVAAVYVGNRGPLALDGGLAGLAAVSAEGRPHPALWQREIQARLAALHYPGEPLEALLLNRIRSPAARRAFEARLTRHQRDLALEGFTVVQRLDGEMR